MARRIQLVLIFPSILVFLLQQQQSVYLFVLGAAAFTSSNSLFLVATTKIRSTRNNHNNIPQRIVLDFRRPPFFSAFLKVTAVNSSSRSVPLTRLKMSHNNTGGGEVLLKDDSTLLISDASKSRIIKVLVATNNEKALPPSVAHGNTCTLASDYWIECNIINDNSCKDDHDEEDNVYKYYTWSLVPLSRIVPDLEPEFQQSNGATAWTALYKRYSNNNDDKNATDLETRTRAAAALTLQSRISRHDNSIHVTVVIQENEQNQVIMTGANDPLIAVLSRVLAQWTITLEEEEEEAESSSTVVAELRTIHWPDGTTTTLPAVLPIKKMKEHDDDDESRQYQTERMQLLYKNIFNITPQSEIVEMVDHQGLVLGCVPRKLVHEYNLLHRGIGMFVTRDKPIFIPTSRLATKTHTSNSVIQQQQQQPDLYVHQRTSTKRIFPSLYDMFVGGVALAGESSQLTACREVAEELGLQQALLLKNNNQLSNCIFTCTVCTSYNRCVVDFFTYAMNTTMEHVSWQEEEVTWGDFVPYHIVESAANLSIQRLIDCNRWPGKYPPSSIIQSRQEVQLADSTTTTTTMTTTKFDNEEWKTWDFVPDGLLVWEAWLQFLAGATKE